jgi:hypothetical protein
MSNKPDNTIAFDGTPSEMDRAAMGLTMDDFFGAVREIRENGVPFYDEEHDAYFTIKVDMAELAKHDPEIFDPGESLEATLYGVFEAIHLQDPVHRGCETRGYFDEQWKYWKSDRKMKKFPPEFIAYRSLVGALTRWLHVIMEPMLEKEIEKLKGETGNGDQTVN